MDEALSITESQTAALAPIALEAMPQHPLVSIIITNYNYARYVGRAIESVIAQTYRHFELIVVDDGSNDNSCEVIEQYVKRDGRIRLLRKDNGGLASAWNAGYAESRGEIFCPLDADDMFHPERLEQMLQEFRKHFKSGLWVHSMTVIDTDDRIIQEVPFLTRFETGWVAPAVLRRGGRWRYMPTSAIAMRRELCERIFPIAEDTFHMHADALAVTLGPLLTEICATNRPLSFYRVHGANSLGGDVRDAISAKKVIHFTLATIEGVNACLARMGLPQRLCIEKNLEYLQARFVQQLFSGEGRTSLLREYRRLIASLLCDDLFRPIQKLMGIGVFGIAALLGPTARAWWIQKTLGYAPWKKAVQRMISACRSFAARCTSVWPRHNCIAGTQRT